MTSLTDVGKLAGGDVLRAYLEENGSVQISSLTDGSPLQSTDEFIVARSGADYKIPASAIVRATGTAFNLSDYGGVGDCIHVSDAAVTASSTALACTTSSPFTVADVGKSIFVAGAGSAGSNLLTTIVGFTDAGHITLSAAAATTVSAATCVYGTDNTGAIQNAVNAAFQSADAHVQILVDGTGGADYLVSGALQTKDLNNVGTYAAQVTIPTSAASSTTPRKIIELVGTGPPLGLGCGGQQIAAGARITTVLSITSRGAALHPCVIGGPDTIGIHTYLELVVSNLLFRGPANPSLCAVNGQGIASLRVEECAADTFDGSSAPADPGPTNPWAAAFIWPYKGNSGFNRARNLFVQGYYCPFVFNEHFDGDNLNAYYCYLAAGILSDSYASGVWHSARIGYLSTENCTWYLGGYSAAGVAKAMTVPVTIEHLDAENNTSTHWYGFQGVVYDPACAIYAKGRFRLADTRSAPNVGAANVQLLNMLDPDPSHEWRKELDPFATPAASVGTWAPLVNVNMIGNGSMTNDASAAANDEIDFIVHLDAGNWQIDLLTSQNTDAAIVTAEIDGTSIGTYDAYAAAPTYNRLTSFPVAIPKTGRHQLKFLAASKNASASAYKIRAQKITCRRVPLLAQPTLPVTTGLVANWDAAAIGQTDGLLTSWPDSSGNGHTLSGGVAPTYYAIYGDTSGGTGATYPAVIFDGATAYLVCTDAALNLSGAFSVLAVVRYANASAGMVWMTGQLATGKRRAFWNDNGVASFSGYAANTVGTLNITSGGHIVQIDDDGSNNIAIYGDGIAKGSGTPALTAFTYSGFAVGADVTGAEFYGGVVHQILVYNSQLSSTDRSTMYSWLKAKWGTP